MNGQLILLRHGQSVWNLENRFTGWVDVPLSKKGIEEAKIAGQTMKEIRFDQIFMSTLVRSHQTTFLAMAENIHPEVPVVEHQDQKGKEFSEIYDEEVKKSLIPTVTAWQLNERMYGELQGLNKDAMRKKFGPEQVQIWRRSYATNPPGGESLKDTKERVIPYYEKNILPLVIKGKTILVSAHGNSLRAIMMELDNLSEEEVVSLEIPTGLPIRYICRAGCLLKESF